MDIKTRADDLEKIASSIPILDKIPELDYAIKATILANNAIMKTYHKAYKVSKKADNSPVTDADIESNDIIKDVLGHTRHTILSEEDIDDNKRLSKNTVWIVDPLDGTSDFIDRTGEFTVMVSLVKDGIPILGVIGWPVEGMLFVAQKGAGAYRYSKAEWQRMSVTTVSDISMCRVVGSRHHLTSKEKSFIKSLGTKEFTSVGSSLKVVNICRGQAEIYITTTNKMKEWDTAASYCIITEAGGKMTDMKGDDITYNNPDVRHLNGIMATNGLMHEGVVRDFKAGYDL